MPADRLLNTVLQLYRSVHDEHKTNQIVGSTTNLLTTLSNPLNLGVLTSQLLTAPAIWHRRDGLHTSVRIMSIYNTAAIRVRENELENAKSRATGSTTRQGGGIRADDWARAVVKGADDRSSRWRHLVLLTGILMGMESNEKQSLSSGLRNTLEEAVVTATNLSLEQLPLEDGPLAGASIVLALNYAFPLLSDFHRGLINCDALLPLAIEGITGEDGFQNGSFLANINSDVKEVGPQLHWSSSAPSFHILQGLGAKPLMGAIGPLSKLAAFAAERARDSSAPFRALNALLEFTGLLRHYWQANRLSTVDQPHESVVYTSDALQTTTPALWDMFRKIMFTVVTVLQAVVARSLLDPGLRNDTVAPQVADLTLRTLRNLFFVSSRDGNDAFQIYSFTYLTSIDIIARYPDACVAFLSSMKPVVNPNPSAVHPVDRALDLFYLNVSEHLPLNVPTQACDELIVQPATAYLTPQSQQQLAPATSSLTTELFEAAHSAILSTLSCPHNGVLTVSIVPFYIDTLFASFPSHISPRQFRVAFKTVMQIVSPPFPIAATDPHLSETLLEMLRFRALGASTAPLPPTPDAAAQEEQEGPALSEQSALVITLVDALPFLPLPLVEEWLSVTARTMNEIADLGLRQVVRDRFLEVLVSGEMDVERASVGVTWWGTKGGQQLVLGSPSAAAAQAQGQQQVPVMSGALQGGSGSGGEDDGRASKL